MASRINKGGILRHKKAPEKGLFWKGVSFIERKTINFIGDGISIVDDAINKKTDITITGAGGQDMAYPARVVPLSRGYRGANRIR